MTCMPYREIGKRLEPKGGFRMKEINIPINIKMKLNGKPYPRIFYAGKLNISAKYMATWRMLLYVSGVVLIKSMQSLMKIK